MNKIIQGDSLSVLKTLGSESVNCCVTSPPYWALRDYGVEGQLGLEPTFQEYISKLCDIFNEVKRVLRKDGTCWVNLGDSYIGGGGGNYGNGISTACGKNKHLTNVANKPAFLKANKLQAKSLCLIPQRFVIEMLNRGWILRNTIIWHKPNCMPSSVKDRFTIDFEYIFFFVKNKKYWFEQQYEPNLTKISDVKWGGNQERSYVNGKSISDKNTLGSAKNPKGRNKRTVWKINIKPFKGAHFAVFPEKLVETPIKAGCPKGRLVLDPFCGSGTSGVVAQKLGRDFIGIELNPEYVKIAEKRIASAEKELRLF